MSSFKKKLRFDSLFYKLYLYKNLYIKEKFFLKRKSYSQFKEDIFIQNFFKNNLDGVYVDIGCYHPIKYSNTALLYNRGWSGYNIDINKASIDLFKIARPNDINLNYCLSSQVGEKVDFYVEHLFSAINSIDIGHLKDFNVKHPIKFSVKTQKFENLVKKKFNFLNIDCEGYDLEMIKLINLNFYQPDLICIEVSEKNKNNIFCYLESMQYNFIKKNSLSYFFERNLQ